MQGGQYVMYMYLYVHIFLEHNVSYIQSCTCGMWQLIFFENDYLGSCVVLSQSCNGMYGVHEIPYRYNVYLRNVHTCTYLFWLR